MKMSEKTLLKKIEQAFAENCCNGSYKLELEHDYDECTYYVLYYTYETGETIAVDIKNSFLGEVNFYSPVHGYYISNFNNHIKSVINVLRIFFDLIDSNKKEMIKYYEIEPEEPEETEEATATEEIKESTEDCNEYKEISDRKESTDRDRINYLMGTHSFPSISDMYNDKCFCCPADRPGNRCCGEKWCAETWKRYEAIIKPEWHHVSLSTLTNLDFDKLDEKRQLYLSLYIEVKELIHDLRKCKSGRAYEKRLAKMYSRNADLVHEHKVTSDFIRYVTRKISMCNVESGLWVSSNEESTGYHKSRRYNQLTMRY